ncbi:hypothetical protein L1987_47972 [Smallanthus sonchifolius]|uniref:Uncharacterized protein n=1 Tax=Smallanthus sonchifolius TaxID=185202 RepID=A0ACB9FR87_9ASTR|nr:hypothetical protein L1987_47972 [Smallanthus sonchifolius]
MSNLVHLNLDGTNFSLADEVMRSMAAFPSLRFLSLEYSELGGSLFANELPNLPDLEVLLLSFNNFNGTLPMEALASFHHLEVLDLTYNNFIGSIPSTIKLLSSLKVVSFALNKLNGSLPHHGFCELKNLHELDLYGNMFDGNLPQCFNTLSSLNSFSNHTKLKVVQFISNNDKFEVETEEPIGWIPKFQLSVLVLSKCNINKPKGTVLPGFLLMQHKLHILDMSHNSIQGQFPNWLIENNTMLEVLNLRNNLFSGTIMLSHKNQNIRIPKFLGELSNLRILLLGKNNFTGSIPKQLCRLTNVTLLDLSSNSLSGDIPDELGLLTQIRIMNLSHNMLTGRIPLKLSNLTNMESLDLSSNCLTGKVPQELTKSATAYNNLSGKLPEMKAQFSTFTKESYQGNPLLCGPPLEKKCTTESHKTYPSNKEETYEQWYDVDLTSFYGSCGSTWFVFMFGFATLLYIHPYWRRRWLDLVEECMYTCYYYLCDLVRKLVMLFLK